MVLCAKHPEKSEETSVQLKLDSYFDSEEKLANVMKGHRIITTAVFEKQLTAGDWDIHESMDS